MIVYNTYTKQLSRKKAVFLVKLQDLKFFLEVAEIIAELKNNFANKKKKNN